MIEQKVNLPKYVKEAIAVLKSHGYSSFIVGGCVRDTLMGRVPYDYDICTSALPSEILNSFSNYRTIETGIKHGTVTVVIDGENLEITTFRTDGEYKNHRKPENVSFVNDIKTDLSRRDFTMNAIAYNDDFGMIDLFGGIKDIENKVIKTVGNAETRFGEDSLRMLRALRFCSTLGFEIETETKNAIKKLSNEISYTSAPRQHNEIKKMLLGDNLVNAICENKELVFTIIPELSAMIGCEQICKYHQYDVFDHTMKALENTPKDLNLRTAILLHDIGKPLSKQVDDNGNSHFKGHDILGAKMARTVLERLCFEKKTTDYVCKLIENHSIEPLPVTESDFVHFFKRFGKEMTVDLFTMMFCDLMGKSDYIIEKEYNQMKSIIEQSKRLSSLDVCYRISHLDINGNDLLKIGIYGKEISKKLNFLLDMVIDKKIENKKEKLIEFLKKE